MTLQNQLPAADFHLYCLFIPLFLSYVKNFTVVYCEDRLLKFDAEYYVKARTEPLVLLHIKRFRLLQTLQNRRKCSNQTCINFKLDT